MVKTIRNIAICILLLSCEDTENREGADAILDSSVGEIYICHNPGDIGHGKRCTNRCLITNGAYCWLLKREDCVGELLYQWQEENCHFFD